MGREIVHILDQISRSKGIDRTVLIAAVEEGIVSAARKNLDSREKLEAHLNLDTGQIELFALRVVVQEVEDPYTEISLVEAKKLLADAEVGDELEIRKEAGDLGRIAAQVAKQVITQRVREAERDLIYNYFKDRHLDLINGIVVREDKNGIHVDLGRTEALLPRSEMSPRDAFRRGDRIRAVLVESNRQSSTPGSPKLILSRTHPAQIRRLFEMEIPEIKEGTIEVVNVVREPGKRAKVMVRSKDLNIDPVGACVGQRGSRVQSIVRELNGENIDIIPWTEDVKTLIMHALNPAKVKRVEINEEGQRVRVVVKDDQLSLAIGKKGQNVRLAVKLTGWDIDIKSESDLLREKDEQFIKEKNAHWLFQKLPGVGSKLAHELVGLGLYSYEDIAAQDPKSLIDLPGVGLKKAEALIHAAQSQLDSGKEIQE